MPLCGCTDALAAIAVWSPFVKTAAPMTKTSASTCAPFVALTEKFFGKLFSKPKSRFRFVCYLCCVRFALLLLCCFARRKTRLANTIIPQKPPISRVFAIFFNSRPALRHSRRPVPPFSPPFPPSFRHSRARMARESNIKPPPLAAVKGAKAPLF